MEGKTRGWGMGRRGVTRDKTGCEKGPELGVKRRMTETSITTHQLDKSLNFLSYIYEINNCRSYKADVYRFSP